MMARLWHHTDNAGGGRKLPSQMSGLEQNLGYEVTHFLCIPKMNY